MLTGEYKSTTGIHPFFVLSLSLKYIYTSNTNIHILQQNIFIDDVGWVFFPEPHTRTTSMMIMIMGQRHDSTTQRLRKSRPSLPRQQQQQKYHRKTSDVTGSSSIKYNDRMIDTRSQWKFLVRNICICILMLLIVRDVGRCCHQNENTATPTSVSTTITYHMIITVHSWTYHKHYNPIPIRRTTRSRPWTYTAVASSSSSLLQNRHRRDESHYATAPQRSVEEEEMSIDLDTVSDTEALLACYAYLQRKTSYRNGPPHKNDMDAIYKMMMMMMMMIKPSDTFGKI